MKTGKNFFCTLLFCSLFTSSGLSAQDEGISQGANAIELAGSAVNHWRGISSYTEMTMAIHRPDWEPGPAERKIRWQG